MVETGLAVAIATLVVTAIALIGTIRQFRAQLQLNFFADYTKRYQEIILNFPESINEATFQLSALPPDDRDRTLRYMRAYFDLCSEEYYLWRKRRIDNETWREWETGIKFAFSKPAFQQAWATLRLDTVYYGAFTEFVGKSMPSGA